MADKNVNSRRHSLNVALASSDAPDKKASSSRAKDVEAGKSELSASHQKVRKNTRPTYTYFFDIPVSDSPDHGNEKIPGRRNNDASSKPSSKTSASSKAFSKKTRGIAESNKASAKKSDVKIKKQVVSSATTEKSEPVQETFKLAFHLLSEFFNDRIAAKYLDETHTFDILQRKLQNEIKRFVNVHVPDELKNSVGYAGRIDSKTLRLLATTLREGGFIDQSGYTVLRQMAKFLDLKTQTHRDVKTQSHQDDKTRSRQDSEKSRRVAEKSRWEAEKLYESMFESPTTTAQPSSRHKSSHSTSAIDGEVDIVAEGYKIAEDPSTTTVQSSSRTSSSQVVRASSRQSNITIDGDVDVDGDGDIEDSSDQSEIKVDIKREITRFSTYFTRVKDGREKKLTATVLLNNIEKAFQQILPSPYKGKLDSEKLSTFANALYEDDRISIEDRDLLCEIAEFIKDAPRRIEPPKAKANKRGRSSSAGPTAQNKATPMTTAELSSLKTLKNSPVTRTPRGRKSFQEGATLQQRRLSADLQTEFIKKGLSAADLAASALSLYGRGKITIGAANSLIGIANMRGITDPRYKPVDLIDDE